MSDIRQYMQFWFPWVMGLAIGVSGAAAALLAAILWQVKVLNKTRKLHAVLEIIKKLESPDTRRSRKYIHTHIPVDIGGLSDAEMQAHLEQSEPALISFNVVGYLISDGYIDADPILATHWITIWRCWMKTKVLVEWAAEKRGYRDHLRPARFLYEEAEKYRVQKGYPEPKYYTIESGEPPRSRSSSTA